MGSLRLRDRIAVITGGSRGIGKGIGIALAQEGADIIFSYASNHAAAEETASQIRSMNVRCLAVCADAGKEDDVLQMMKTVKKQFGKINVLVNNAGTIGKSFPVKDMPNAEWDRLISVDLRSMFLYSKSLLSG